MGPPFYFANPLTISSEDQPIIKAKGKMLVAGISKVGNRNVAATKDMKMENSNVHVYLFSHLMLVPASAS
jgi:hypothetical protein